VLPAQPNKRPKNFVEFLGMIGNLYTKAGLSPPFHIEEYAKSWLAEGISPSHCLEQIRLDLAQNGRNIRSGSGDDHLLIVHEIIVRTWYQSRYRSTASTIADQLTECEASVEVVDESPDDQANLEWPPAPPPREPAQSAGDLADAFLLQELADGELPANELSRRAKAAGIADRTLDRARARLGIRARRTGFGRTGQHWVSLPKPRSEP
jgi:hypothetical protein